MISQLLIKTDNDNLIHVNFTPGDSQIKADFTAGSLSPSNFLLYFNSPLFPYGVNLMSSKCNFNNITLVTTLLLISNFRFSGSGEHWGHSIRQIEPSSYNLWQVLPKCLCKDLLHLKEWMGSRSSRFTVTTGQQTGCLLHILGKYNTETSHE